MQPQNDKNGADLQRRRGAEMPIKAKLGDVSAVTRESRSIGRSSSQFAATAMGMSSSGRQTPNNASRRESRIRHCLRLCEAVQNKGPGLW